MERRKELIGERQQRRRLRREVEEWELNLSSSSEEDAFNWPVYEQHLPDTGNVNLNCSQLVSRDI